MLLHFGAVDYACAVQVNGHLAGGHRGGYWPFTLDITDLLNGTGRNSLWVAVQDPTCLLYTSGKDCGQTEIRKNGAGAL